MKFNFCHIVFVLIIFLVSCSKDFKDTTFGIYGGSIRASSYEAYGILPMQILSNEPLNIEDSSGIIQPPVAFGPQDYLIATNAGSIIRLADTRSIWQYKLDSGEVAFTSIAGLLTSGTSAFITNFDKFIGLDKDGKQLFKIKLNDSGERIFTTYSEPLALDDGFVIGDNNGNVAKFDTGGNLLKSLKFSQAITKLIAAEGNNLVFGVSHNLFGKADTLVICNLELNLKIQIGIENFRILAGPIIYNKRIYIAGSKESRTGRLGRILAFDMSGNIVFDVETDMVIRQLSLDNSENIYASGFNSGIAEYFSGFYSFDSQGKDRWTLYLKSSVISPLIICKKYLTFTGLTIDGAGVFTLRKSDGTLVKLNSLNEMPLLYLHPAVTTEPILVFFGSEKPLMVKLTQTQLDKILPW